MKQLGLFILMVMFLANTIVVSAWAAKPCMMNNNLTQVSHDMSMSDEMPCHDNQNQNQQDSKHCEGMCLCLHASTTKTPVINSADMLPAPVSTSEKLVAENEIMDSRATYPPHRPPILIS